MNTVVQPNDDWRTEEHDFFRPLLLLLREPPVTAPQRPRIDRTKRIAAHSESNSPAI